jgi:hypothetical protein
MKTKGVAYLLWALGFVGLCGLHRLYLGKGATGLLWLLTLGLCLIGQVTDLASIPRMVDEANALRRAALGLPPQIPPSVDHAGAPQGAAPREVIREREIITVKVRCQHCGTLVDPQASKCPNCAAPMR